MDQLPWWAEEKGVRKPKQRRRSLADVKRDLPITRVLRYYGLDFRGTGADWQPVICPFHPDTKPSASINIYSQRFRCHVCDMGGDVIDVVAAAEGLETKDAMEWIEQHLL